MLPPPSARTPASLGTKKADPWLRVRLGNSGSCSEQLLHELLQLHNVGGEGADALGGLFGGHGVLVEGEAEGLLVEADLLQVGGGGGFRGNTALKRLSRSGEFAEQA